VRVAVADTSPLRYLLLISAIEVLPRLFERVTIPKEVHAELLHARTPAAVRHWATTSPSPWLMVVQAPSDAGSDLRSLDPGERAAIALATASAPDLVLIDDRAAVAVARARGLDVTGTLGVLDRAARRGLLDLPAAIAALRATNFHARPELLEALLARHSDEGGGS
jgi:predicted nucleic acid-binding protein